LSRITVLRLVVHVSRKTDRLFWRRQQRVKYALLGGVFGAVTELRYRGLANHLDGDVHQVADDTVDLTTHITNLSELGRLDLDERGFRQSSKTS